MRLKLFFLQIILSLVAFSRAGFFNLKKSLLSVEGSEPSFLQGDEQRLLPLSSQVGSSKSPTVKLFPGESDCIPLANQQQRGKKRIREDNIIEFRLDPRPGFSQAAIAQVDKQLSGREKLRPASLSLEQGLPTASNKNKKPNNLHINAAHDDFFKGYEKNYFDVVKASLLSSDKDLRAERWISSPTAEDRNIIDGSLRENLKSASKSELFDKLQDNSSNAGDEKQAIAVKILPNTALTIIESSSTSDIFHTIKDQHITTGASSSKNFPTENSPAFSLPSSSEKDYFRAMSLARSSFKKYSQLGSIDFKIFLKKKIEKINQNGSKKASRSYKLIVTNINMQKLYNPEIKPQDFLYAKGRETLPLSESIKSDQFEKLYQAAITPKSSVVLILLKQYVYDDHKFNQIIALQSLDNYFESVFKRTRSKKFCSEMVFGSMTGIKSPSEEDSEMINKHKSKVWNQYHTRFRLKVFPQDYQADLTLFKLATQEMGFLMGTIRFKDLKIHKKLKILQRSLKKGLHSQTDSMKEWLYAVNRTSVASLYKIMLLYYIFTPFDSEAIDHLKVNIVLCARELYAALKEILDNKNTTKSILYNQAKLLSKNPFLSEHFLKWFLPVSKAMDIKKLMASGSDLIAKTWLKHICPKKFDFIPWNARKNAKS
ncbi:hypothetical protein PPACK8108_LOCUS8781, partial [Phakopsora pachyrhizi]